MINTKINYSFHLLLTSKYKLIINLLIVLLIYSILYSSNILYCMNDNSDIVSSPATAEAKASQRPSQQILAIKREITEYAVAHLELERMRVHEKIVAYTNMEPNQLINSLEEYKQQTRDAYHQHLQFCQARGRRPPNPLPDFSSPEFEKDFIKKVVPKMPWYGVTHFYPGTGGSNGCGASVTRGTYPVEDHAGIREVYYLLRMYRRLNGRDS